MRHDKSKYHKEHPVDDDWQQMETKKRKEVNIRKMRRAKDRITDKD